MEASSSTDRIVASDQDDIISYDVFDNAIKEGDMNNIETLIRSFYSTHGSCTAFHYVLRKLRRSDNNREGIVALFLNQMPIDDLEKEDEHGDTPLVIAVKKQSRPLGIVKQMINKNPNLANIGRDDKALVYLASEKGLKEVTEHLELFTDDSILLSMQASTMSSFLWNLVHMSLFEIASGLVKALPHNLRISCPYHTISALAPKFSSTTEPDIIIRSKALDFLKLVWSTKSRVYEDWFADKTCSMIVKNAENGSMEFVEQLFKIRPDILESGLCRTKLFVHAVEKREKNIFNLVYPHIQPNDFLESFKDKMKNNILHSATKLAPSYVLNRKSGAVLQMQSELQWFQEVCELASPESKESRNNDGFAPSELFMETHKHLIEAGEKSMKEVAQSCTVVGALIITIMFAAAFTLPGDDDKSTLTKTFIIFDAISLYLSTASVVICLGFFTSRYAEDDFLVSLPWKLILGLSTLFFSLITMMVTFCLAVVILLHKKKQIFWPVVLLAVFPILIFFWSTVSLPYHVFMSTYRPGIVYKEARLLKKANDEALINAARGETNPAIFMSNAVSLHIPNI